MGVLMRDERDDDHDHHYEIISIFKMGIASNQNISNRKSKRDTSIKKKKKWQKTKNHDGRVRNTLIIQLSIFVAIIGIALTSYYGSSPFNFDTQRQPSSSSSSSSDGIKAKSTKINPGIGILQDDDIIINESEIWNQTDPKLTRINEFLSEYLCHQNQTTASVIFSSYCHPLLQPSPLRRTHYTAKTKSNRVMKKGEIVLVLPRDLLIWDLDAMRNKEFVQQELFNARHGSTGNAIDSGGFLASFLLYKQKLLNYSWSRDNNDHSIMDEIGTDRLDQRYFLEYMNILPTHDNSQSDTPHPVLWSHDKIEALFGKLTISHRLINAYKDMIRSEYLAFCKSSSNFRNNINEEEYTSMRINVMSRSFGPGPPGIEEQFESETLDKELQFYQVSSGVNLTKGCRAMSPILDMWDHHAKPNVQWMYKKNQRSFVIKVIENQIRPWNDIMVSYGTYTDSHLNAKFGFVNGDGSGHTELSIASMHQLLDVGLGQQYSYMVHDSDGAYYPSEEMKALQSKHLLQYLISDDGYEECIDTNTNPEGYALKILKFKHLQVIANKLERWTVKFKPRDENSKPSTMSKIPIQSEAPRFDPRKVQFDGSKIIPTMRLLALTNEDFDGKAIEVLTKALADDTVESFVVPRQSDELEYRALIWLARLTAMELRKYPTSIRKDMERLSSSAVLFQSSEWTAMQVRLGEMQTLESLRSIALSGTRQMLERIKNKKGNLDTPALVVREKVCDFELTATLLEEK